MSKEFKLLRITQIRAARYAGAEWKQKLPITQFSIYLSNELPNAWHPNKKAYSMRGIRKPRSLSWSVKRPSAERARKSVKYQIKFRRLEDLNPCNPCNLWFKRKILNPESWILNLETWILNLELLNILNILNILNFTSHEGKYKEDTEEGGGDCDHDYHRTAHHTGRTCRRHCAVKSPPAP